MRYEDKYKENYELKNNVKNVFVSGGIPEATYIMRQDLETQLTNVLNTKSLISITGHTKTGKTVLTYGYFKQYSDIEVARINSGEIKTEVDFWTNLAVELKLPIEGETTISEQNDISVMGEAKAQGVFPFMKGQIGTSINRNKSMQIARSLNHADIKNQILEYLKAKIKNTVIVIDDFHYIDEKLRTQIVRSFKQLIFLGLNIIVISIPHREYDAVSREREMAMRINPIKVKEWTISELESIAKRGFDYLCKDMDSCCVRKMAKEAFGSPHLMQDFCLQLSFLLIEQNRFIGSMLCPDDDDLQLVFKDVANKIGKPIFHQLVKGPKREGARKMRKLYDGRSVDIYKLVALLFVNIKPGMSKVTFQQFMEHAKKIVIPHDLPQVSEITRVLKKMAKIAISDSASNPVIDVDDDERCVYIADPYFAYYLKWGDCEV